MYIILYTYIIYHAHILVYIYMYIYIYILSIMKKIILHYITLKDQLIQYDFAKK